jgi:hypothetical protein
MRVEPRKTIPNPNDTKTSATNKSMTSILSIRNNGPDESDVEINCPQRPENFD